MDTIKDHVHEVDDPASPVIPVTAGIVTDPGNVWEADLDVEEGYRILVGSLVVEVTDGGTTGEEQPDFSNLHTTSDGTAEWHPVGIVGALPSAAFEDITNAIVQAQVFGLVQGVAPVEGEDPADIAAKVNEVISRLSDSGLMRAPD